MSAPVDQFMSAPADQPMSASIDQRDARSQKTSKSSRFSNLPFEILNNVFALCDSKDLKQCTLTCHSWRSATRSLLFSTVKVGSKIELEDLSKLALKDNTIRNYVKTLTFQGTYYKLDFQTLYCVSQLFKNIRSMSFRNDETAFDNLYYLLSVGEFSCLREIPKAVLGTSQGTGYLNCVDALQDRIEHIELHSGSTYEPFLGRSSVFPKLESIRIDLGLPSSSAANVIEAVTEKRDMQSLKRIMMMTSVRCFPNDALSTKIEKIQPMPNLALLALGGFRNYTITDDTFMLYTMKKFPNLQSLTICSLDGGFDAIVENEMAISMDVTAKFLDYLSRLRKCYGCSIITEEKTTAIIKKCCSNIKIESLKFKSLHLTYDDEYSPREDLDNLRFPMMTINHSVPLCQYERCIEVIDYRDQNIRPNDPRHQEQALIPQVGEFFTKIALTYAPRRLYGTILKDVVRYCVNLAEMVITYGPRLSQNSFKYKNIAPNYTLSKLTLENCNTTTGLLAFITDVFPNLKTLFVSNTPEFFEPDFSDPNFSGPDAFPAQLSMPNLSIQHLKVELKVPNRYMGGPYKWVCIDLQVGKERKHLFFVVDVQIDAYQDECCGGLEFVKELTKAEFENKKTDSYCLVYPIHCKSLERFSFTYIKHSTEEYYEEVYNKNPTMETHDVYFN